MKIAALLVLAAYQMTATAEDTNHRYIDRQTREAIEKMENAVCGMQSGMYGLVKDPVEYTRPKNAQLNCKTVIPEPQP